MQPTAPTASPPSRRVAPVALALLTVLAVMAAALPASGQSAGTITVDAAGSGTVNVDLRTDTGKALQFRLDEANKPAAQGANSLLVRLARSGATDLITLAAQRGSDGVWLAALSVDQPDLVAGDWSAAFVAYKSTSSTVASRNLHVTLADSTPPRLQVLPLGDPIRLGPGGALELSVQEEFLRAVTVQQQGMPTAASLAEPYRLTVESLPEGLSNVTFTAADRAGQTTTVKVRVDRDTVAPDLSVSVPDVAYQGVPFAILVNATERSQHTVRLLHNGSAETVTVAATPTATKLQHVFVETVGELGNVSFVVEAADIVGNRASTVVSIPVVQPPTDLRVVSLQLAAGPVPYVGHPAQVVATLEQVGGVTALPVEVTFTTAGHSQTSTVTVPAVGPKTVTWSVNLSAGQHEVGVSIVGPAFANETDPGNENATLMVDTYLGSVYSGTKLFLIHADARGLPATAIDQATNKSYALKLVEDGNGVAYQFILPGNTTVQWDPLQPIASASPTPTPSSSASGSTSGGKSSPGAGALVAVLVVALAAVVQRRRA